MERWFQPRRCWKQFAGWSAVYLRVPLHLGLHQEWWSSLETSPLAVTAEPLNLELSEVDDPDGEAVPHIENHPEAPRQPTTGSCDVGHGDPERTVSGSSSRVDMFTGKKKCALCCGGDLGQCGLGNAVRHFGSVHVDHRPGKSRDGSVQWHLEMATTRGDHILK